MGFTDSHTPPIPLLIEVFVFMIGIILFVVNKKRKENYLVHIIGLGINSLIVSYILKLAFSY